MMLPSPIDPRRTDAARAEWRAPHEKSNTWLLKAFGGQAEDHGATERHEPK
jgi:hypothetical protein